MIKVEKIDDKRIHEHDCHVMIFTGPEDFQGSTTQDLEKRYPDLKKKYKEFKDRPDVKKIRSWVEKHKSEEDPRPACAPQTWPYEHPDKGGKVILADVQTPEGGLLISLLRSLFLKMIEKVPKMNAKTVALVLPGVGRGHYPETMVETVLESTIERTVKEMSSKGLDAPHIIFKVFKN